MRTSIASSHPDGFRGAAGRRPTTDLGAALSPILFPIRGFLALGWTRAAAEKIIDPEWWSGAVVTEYVHDHQGLPFMGRLAEVVVEPNAVVVAWIVVIVQLVIAVSVALGIGLYGGLWLGIVLNSVFVAMGSILPSCFYLVIQATLLAAMSRRAPRSSTLWARHWRSVIAVLVAVLLAPFTRTLHPAEVHEDPAMVLVAIAGVVAYAEFLRTPAGRSTPTRWAREGGLLPTRE